MPRITNISPLGDVEVPDLGRIVAAGETVTVDDPDLAAALLTQTDNWTAASKIDAKKGS